MLEHNVCAGCLYTNVSDGMLNSSIVILWGGTSKSEPSHPKTVKPLKPVGYAPAFIILTLASKIISW